MAHKFSPPLPAHAMTAYPRMPPLEPQDSPFLTRVYELVREWVQDEWLVIENIKLNASRVGSPAQVQAAIDEARLTPDTLAKRLDNISRSTLFRELRKLKAPPPYEIIRKTRLEFAKHLLTHTRILIRDVAQRVGFPHEQYFALVFSREFGCAPLEFRRTHITATSAPQKSTGKPRKARKRQKPSQSS